MFAKTCNAQCVQMQPQKSCAAFSECLSSQENFWADSKNLGKNTIFFEVEYVWLNIAIFFLLHQFDSYNLTTSFYHVRNSDDSCKEKLSLFDSENKNSWKKCYISPVWSIDMKSRYDLHWKTWIVIVKYTNKFAFPQNYEWILWHSHTRMWHYLQTQANKWTISQKFH